MTDARPGAPSAQRGVLLDVAGVLLQGNAALPGAVGAVRRIASAGLPYRFVTNTTSKPRRAVLASLRSAGVPAEDGQLFAPAQAASSWLAEHQFAPHLLTDPALSEDFAGLEAAGRAAVVVGDAGRRFSYDSLNQALRLLLDGAPLLALAMNRRFADAEGRPTLDAGAFVTALSYASGVEPRVFGKPAPAFFASACDDMGLPASDVAIIGDDAEADIAGALEAGMGRAVLVQTGKYRPGDETAFSPPPTAMARDVGSAVDALLTG